MHGTFQGSGALVWVFGLLYYGTAALSLYVTIDSLRRPRIHFIAGPDRRLFYLVPQALFLGAFLAGVIVLSIRSATFGLVMLTAAPVMFAHQVMYLLRMVFPTADRRAARLAAAEEASHRTPAGIDRSTGEGSERPE